MAEDRLEGDAHRQFVTTHWSVVVAAGGSLNKAHREALEALCQAYWYPLYAYVRRVGHNPEDAKDLTQAFMSHLLEKGSLRLADRERGRFRTFLLTALKNFLVDQVRRATAQKRGGGRPLETLQAAEGEERYQFEPADHASPDVLYEQGWARAVLAQALARLKEDYASSKHGPGFEHLKEYVWGERSGTSCADLGRELARDESRSRQKGCATHAPPLWRVAERADR